MDYFHKLLIFMSLIYDICKHITEYGVYRNLPRMIIICTYILKKIGLFIKIDLKLVFLFQCPVLSNLQIFSTLALKSSWEIPYRPARCMAPPAPAPSLIVPVSYL